MTRSGEYVCDAPGCDAVLEGDAVGVIWCDTPLGMATLKTCRTQECGRAALAARPDWKMRKGNKPPEPKAKVPGRGRGHARGGPDTAIDER